MEKYYIQKNTLKALINKNKYKEEHKDSFISNTFFSTLDGFILSEIKLYWPLIGKGVMPKIISRDISIAILSKIVDERRVFDGYFNTINSNSIFFASKIYSIMENACNSQIPVEAIAHRIERFKLGRVNSQIYYDLKNIIVEYRSILNKMKVIDMPMVVETYYSKLTENEIYKDSLDKRKIEIIEDRIKMNNMPVYNLYDEQFDNYFDMLIGLEGLLSELILDKGISPKDILIIFPDNTDSQKRMIDDISRKLNIDIKFLSSSVKVDKTDVGAFILSALALKHDCEHILDDEDKIVFLKILFRDVNALRIRKNLNRYMKEARDIIVNFETRADFAKGIYRKYFEPNEEGIRVVEKITNLIKEFSSLEGSYILPIEYQLKYIKQNIYVSNSNKRKIENIGNNAVLFVNYNEFETGIFDKKYIVFFDISSSVYDVKIENEICTEIAFLDDEILSNLNDDNLRDFYKHYSEKVIEERAYRAVNSIGETHAPKEIYLFSSELSLRGFFQENKFKKNFIELIRKG